jgi:hypothetical protein
MFFVADSQARRHKMIRSFLKSQASIAVILAAVDFEWTLRRAILALGARPTKDIREALEKTWGLQKYKDIWNQEVKPRMEVTVVEVIPCWHELTKAFVFRDRLVHGVVGVISNEAANNSVESILHASAALEGFAEKHEGTLYRRIVRRNPRKVKK